MSPLTKNSRNHIKAQYRRAWRNRTTTITLHFTNRGPVSIEAIWKNTDTADPEFGLAVSASVAKTAQSADAAFEVLLDDVPIGLLQGAQYVVPGSAMGGDGGATGGIGGRFLVIEVQPKGATVPPLRAYVLVRRV